MKSLGKTMALAAVMLSLLSSLASAQFGDNVDASTSVGQNNTGYQAASSSGQSYEWQYVKKYYVHCGRQYYYYDKVAVPLKPVPTTVNNPIGAVNTDNSVTHNYTYNITYSQLPTAQGSTLYGYPQGVSPAENYGNTDFGAIFDGIIRASSQMQQDSASILNQTTVALDNATDRFSRVSEIQAKGAQLQAALQGNAEVLRASAEYAKSLASNQIQYQHSVTRGDGKTIVQPENPPAVPDPSVSAGLAPVQAIFNKACAQCHNETKKAGGLSLTNAATLTSQQVDNILDRITSQDPKRMMPPPAEDGTLNPLSPADRKTLFRAAQ